MKAIIFTIVLFLFIGCSTKKEVIKEEPTQDLKAGQPVENAGHTAITTYKENSTLISAVLDTLIILDDYNYELKVKIITAIPDNWNVSVIEPGQVIAIYPAYLLDENQKIDLQNPINQRLFELRNLVKEGMFIGKATLARDNKFYITEVDVWNNPPEMKR